MELKVSSESAEVFATGSRSRLRNLVCGAQTGFDDGNWQVQVCQEEILIIPRLEFPALTLECDVAIVFSQKAHYNTRLYSEQLGYLLLLLHDQLASSVRMLNVESSSPGLRCAPFCEKRNGKIRIKHECIKIADRSRVKRIFQLDDSVVSGRYSEVQNAELHYLLKFHR